MKSIARLFSALANLAARFEALAETVDTINSQVRARIAAEEMEPVPAPQLPPPTVPTVPTVPDLPRNGKARERSRS